MGKLKLRSFFFFLISSHIFLPAQWSWGGACTLNLWLPGSRWNRPQFCRTNQKSQCGLGRRMLMWIPLAGICRSKSCPPTRPWHLTCPTLQGPTALTSDYCMGELTTCEYCVSNGIYWCLHCVTVRNVTMVQISKTKQHFLLSFL